MMHAEVAIMVNTNKELAIRLLHHQNLAKDNEEEAGELDNIQMRIS